MKLAISTAIALLGATVFPAVHAGEMTMTLGSVHFQNNRSHNNVNPGVGYMFDTSVVDKLFGWEEKGHDVVGVYLNSGKRWSLYAGYYRPFSLPDSWKESSQFMSNIEVGVMAGIATGYENRMGVLPALLLVATYPIGKHWGDAHWKMRLTVAPIDSGVATLSLAYQFCICKESSTRLFLI